MLAAGAILAIGSIQAQCTVDPSAQTTPGVSPEAADLPCIERTVAYDQTLQGKIQADYDTTVEFSGFPIPVHVEVDSVSLDSIGGLPTGITWVKNPDILPGGGNGCVRFSGTSTDTVGTYNLSAFGRVWFHITAGGGLYDTTYNYQGNLNQFSPFGNYYLRVIEQGGTCNTGTGIGNLNGELNAALSVFPNPSNGAFNLKLNAAHRLNGSIVIVDMTGKQVYSQAIDVVGEFNANIDLSAMPKGVYAIQVRTNEGFASKTISIE